MARTVDGATVRRWTKLARSRLAAFFPFSGAGFFFGNVGAPDFNDAQEAVIVELGAAYFAAGGEKVLARGFVVGEQGDFGNGVCSFGFEDGQLGSLHAGREEQRNRHAGQTNEIFRAVNPERGGAGFNDHICAIGVGHQQSASGTEQIAQASKDVFGLRGFEIPGIKKNLPAAKRGKVESFEGTVGGGAEQKLFGGGSAWNGYLLINTAGGQEKNTKGEREEAWPELKFHGLDGPLVFDRLNRRVAAHGLPRVGEWLAQSRRPTANPITTPTSATTAMLFQEFSWT